SDLLTEFVSETGAFARVNILGQKLLQLAMPGVPDVYQGCEMTGLALVDPDNRRPVDYGRRRERLQRLDTGRSPKELDDEKLLVTSRTLRLRRAHPEWVGPGSRHEPVAALGPAAEPVVGVARGEAVALATRLPAGPRRGGGAGPAPTGSGRARGTSRSPPSGPPPSTSSGSPAARRSRSPPGCRPGCDAAAAGTGPGSTSSSRGGGTC